MTEIQLGAKMWHPCSVGIIEHRVNSITKHENFSMLELKAVDNVGACGKIEVYVIERDGKYYYTGLEHPSIPHASGLQDFVTGEYFTTRKKAEAVFIRQRVLTAHSRVLDAERSLAEAKKAYDDLNTLLKTLNS